MNKHQDNKPILLSYDDLRQFGIKYSREHLRRLEADSKFPERIRLSPSRVVWLQSEILEWLDERIAMRHQKKLPEPSADFLERDPSILPSISVDEDIGLLKHHTGKPSSRGDSCDES